MNTQNEPRVRLPARIDDLIKKVSEASKAFRLAYQRSEEHSESAGDAWDAAMQQAPHQDEMMAVWEAQGKHLYRDLDTKQTELINAAQELASAYDALDIPF